MGRVCGRLFRHLFRLKPAASSPINSREAAARCRHARDRGAPWSPAIRALSFDPIRPGATIGIAAGSALALFGSLPFLVATAPEPIPSFDAEWLAAALGLAAIALAALATPAALARWPRSAVLFAAFAVLVAGQGIAGAAAHPRLASLACLYLLWAGGMTWLGAAVRARVDGDRLLAGLAIALAVAACADAIAALLQTYGTPAVLRSWVLPMDGLRPGGNLGQPNHLALLTLWGLVSLAWLALRIRRPGLLVAPMLLLVTALVLSASRAGFLAGGALAVGAWIAGPGLAPAAPRRLRRGVALAVLAFAVLVGLDGHRPANLDVGSRFSSAAARVDQRPALWRGAVAVFAESPLAGAGHGRFAARYFEIAPDIAGPRPDSMSTHAHNVVLQIAAEYGLIGLAILVAGSLAWAAGLRVRGSAAGAWALGLVLPAAIQSLFEYPLWYAYFLGPFAFALGAAEGPRLEFAGRRALPIVLAAASLTGAVLLSDLWRDFAFLRAFRGPSRPALLAQGDEALRRRRDALARESLLAVYVEVGMHRALVTDGRGLAAKLAFSREVMRSAPLPDVAWRHVALLDLADDPAAAAAARRRAMASYPADAPRARPSNLAGEMP